MKIKHPVLLILMLCSYFSVAQAPNIAWQKTYGGSQTDVARDIVQTSEGGFIVVGYSSSNDGNVTGNHGSSDFWLIKLGVFGNLEWQKSFGGTSMDWGKAIAPTTDNGYIVAGLSASSNGDVSVNYGNWDNWILKLTPGGDVVWSRVHGGSSYEPASSVQQTDDGGYITTGYTQSTNGDVEPGSHGELDYWTVKMNSFGDIQWQRASGGVGAENSFSVQQTADGGFVIAGYSESSNSGDASDNHGGKDFWIVKLNAIGNIQWQKSLGGSNNDVALAFQQSDDGGFVAVGYSESYDGDLTTNNGATDFWIVKIDEFGNLVWQKSYGGSEAEIAYCIDKTFDGGFVVGGYSSSNNIDLTENLGQKDFWVIKLNGDGELEWQKSLGGSGNEIAHSIIQTMDSGYVVAGYSYSSDGDVTENYGDQDYWVVKLGGTNYSIQLCEGDSILFNPNESCSGTWASSDLAIASIYGNEEVIGVSAGTATLTFTSSNGNCSNATYQVIVNELPTVFLGNDTSLCDGSTLILNAGNAGNSYIWNTSETTQTITAESTGLYSVAVTNNTGCTSTDTIQVNFNPAPIVFLGNDTSLCVGGTLILNAGNAGNSYIWNTSETTQTITAESTGLYSVAVTNNTGCTSTDTIQVNFNPAPSVFLGNDTSLCDGGTLILNAGNAGNSYIWNTSETTQMITAESTGLYSVAVTDNTGCTSTDTIQVNFNPAPIVFLGNDTSFCDGGTLILNAGNAGNSYIWNTSETTQSISVSTTSLYSVTVSNSDGCAATDNIQLIVHPWPQVFLGNDTVLCVGNPLTLNADNQGSTYVWNTSETTQSITVDATGIYSVAVTNSGGCSASDAIFVNFNPAPIASFNTDPLLPVEPNTPITFYSTSTGADSWYWTSGNNQWSSNESVTFEYSAVAFYDICLKVSTVDGCWDITCLTIEIRKDLAIPNIITPNGDGMNDVFFITGLPLLGNNKLTIYNRWGTVIYHADDYKNNWGGDNSKGNKVSEGEYYYVLTLRSGQNITGDISILF